MPTNVAQFQAKLKAKEAFILGSVVTKLDNIVEEMHEKIIERTPIRTGRAKANWFIKEGSPGDEVDQAPTYVPSKNPFKTVFIYNNLPYIQFLENGSSSQAPNGMLAITVAEYRARLTGFFK